jgi:hypothetical protein
VRAVSVQYKIEAPVIDKSIVSTFDGLKRDHVYDVETLKGSEAMKSSN